MSSQLAQTEPRILLTAVRELDQLARRFRRRLRDVAVELLGKAGHSGPIGPETVLAALPLVCGELLADAGSRSGDGRDLDGRKKEAA
jgi:hypothetical protein